MPSRLTITFIVAFWLGCVAWYIVREVAPRWDHDAAPPYHIDLTDEIRAPPIAWTVFLKDKRVGTGITSVSRIDAHTFELRGEFNYEKAEIALGVQLRKYKNRLVVTRDGRLRETETHMSVTGAFDADVSFSGKVVEDELQGEVSLRSTLITANQALQVPLHNGKILSPQHPLNRVPGLAVDKRWTEPVLDLASGLGGLLGKKAPSLSQLEAEVSEDILKWRHEDVTCFKLEYFERRGPERILRGRTWVRKHDGLVLQQEAHESGVINSAMIMVRES